MKLSLTGGVAVVLLVAAAIWYHTCRVRDLQQRQAQTALRADSVEAAADTTRLVAAAVARRLGDSLQGVERRIVQEQQRADQLDRDLGRERLFRGAIVTRLAALEAKVTGQGPITEDAAGVRLGTFHLREPPWTADARVELPPPPDSGRMQLRVGIDPIRLQPRLGCGPPNADGIRPATLTVVGPAWARVELDSLSQSPELCDSPALRPHGVRVPGWVALVGMGLSFLAGLLAPL